MVEIMVEPTVGHKAAPSTWVGLYARHVPSSRSPNRESPSQPDSSILPLIENYILPLPNTWVGLYARQFHSPAPSMWVGLYARQFHSPAPSTWVGLYTRQFHSPAPSMWVGLYARQFHSSQPDMFHPPAPRTVSRPSSPTYFSLAASH